DDWARGDRAGDQGGARCRALAARLLRRVGRPAQEAGDRQGAGGVTVYSVSTCSHTASLPMRCANFTTHWPFFATHSVASVRRSFVSTFQQSNVPAGTCTRSSPTTC